MKVWIVWLPNVGKSTLFNALTQNYSADVGNFPFCTIQPNVGIVNVNDPRLNKLAELSNSQKIVPATIKFVDIAGLVKWASKWEGLWNQFLSNIQEVDAIIQVLRDFEDKDVWHVIWRIDPIDDAQIINMELIISDLEKLEKITKPMEKIYQFKQDKEVLQVYPILQKAKKLLEEWKLLYDHMQDFPEEATKIFKQYGLLTYKPIIYALNIQEDKICEADRIVEKYKQLGTVIPVCAKLEYELIWLDKQDKQEYLEDFNCNVTEKVWLDNLIKKAFDILQLMYFFTTGEKETKAWQIKKWSTAPQAAWKIHTDFEKWFIKAEVVNFNKLIEAWSWSKAKEAWFIRLEWKDYIVQDGDVIIFKFNV